MKKPHNTGFRRIINATGYSLQGLRAALTHEAAFRQEICLLGAGTLTSFCLHVSTLERIALIGSLVLVLIVELLNSAVEAVVDRISEEHHPLSGRAKDYGSAAVLLALLLAGGVWISIVSAHL